MRELSLHLVLGHLLISHVASTCIPVECLRCNVTGEALADSCGLCPNITDCINDFKVFINGTQSEAQEGDDITLTCLHNISDMNVTYKWNKDGTELKNKKGQKLSRKVLSKDAGEYICSVQSLCGNYTSSPHDVTVHNNSVILLVICGVAALALVLVLGLAMKFKLEKDKARHRERMQQRAQIGQTGGPTPFTPRDS
ncbi:uncharacterized protein LOC103354383 isoform X2 [Stegastes partitus]|uniref:Uncharacterized protein LOC103354383 isoform X2 n=1 Tax=Stegastes partitus TaxID=144197 RepID=A0A9Y4JRF7_9TELE|nr:PREDICTED: uncharacterized protein LOC103354383 isoform X2 [Stegastes partitus]